MLCSSTITPETVFPQSLRYSSVRLLNQLSFPCMITAECLGHSEPGRSASWMLLHVEHTARMARHTARSHRKYCSTSSKNKGGSSEPHWLCPAARAASTTSTSAFSRAASVGCATAHARSRKTRQSSI